jgi:hypothetical protein
MRRSWLVEALLGSPLLPPSRAETLRPSSSRAGRVAKGLDLGLIFACWRRCSLHRRVGGELAHAARRAVTGASGDHW